jgi:hypothetical protein
MEDPVELVHVEPACARPVLSPKGARFVQSHVMLHMRGNRDKSQVIPRPPTGCRARYGWSRDVAGFRAVALDFGRRWRKCDGIEAIDLFQTPPGDALEIAVHSDRGGHQALELGLAFCPLLPEGFPLGAQIFLHAGEGLDDRLDTLAQAETNEVYW